MTLVVTYMSQDFVVLASDRRVTWQIGGSSKQWEDTENKAIALCGHFLMGYTGFARFGGVRTDQWVVELLAGTNPQEYFDTLARAAEPEIHAMPLELPRKGHVFAAVGYAQRSIDALDLVPCAFDISNALGANYGSWTPREDFRISRYVLPESQPFVIGTYPNQSRALVQLYIKHISRYRKKHPDRILGVAQLMMDLIRKVALHNVGVSKDVSISILPRSAVPATGVAAGGLSEPVTELRCYTSSAERNLDYVPIYSPASACGNLALWNAQVRFGSSEPIGPPRDPAPPPGLR